MRSYDHLVHIDVDNRRLVIHRIHDDGTRPLFTFVDPPEAMARATALASFARPLGENLLLDSPAARELLGL